MRRSVIIGCGAYLPKRVIDNAEMSRLVDTTDEWIIQRTGIKTRHIAAEGEFTSDLAVAAAEGALARARRTAADIDLVILATSTPDNTFPATATTVQARLGIDQGAAFDIHAVCTGFVYALSVADAMIRTGAHRRALVIGAETYSRILDWSDRTTCVLFGDGAGAVVLEAREEEAELAGRGILATKLRADGRHKSKLYVDGGPSTTQTTGHLRMEGKEVFKLAVGMVPGIVHDILGEEGLKASDIDWFVPHQANERIILATADKLGIPREKVILTVADHANTSSASIPLALDRAVADGRIKEGDLLLLEAMGGGFTWGAALVRW
ncbi:beta-ketoacyl-ACP synthase III [Candidatus Raskinella chloraquaticus]|jgi:3-oxoacyl-[acyl-carrier-protein] synthase III|uniref:Beta-ketoacyl-[acyl-carrier-protein] synthase III n=1 Tax=Candidatus Raskinella chloraquaticus TaxID=1951219 RepID=A0A1W9HPE2_9HYPH|nr:MAG: 3-oxoacyl-ACP synthase [Proteobacteria bacterium SG_bin8]